MPTLSRSAIAIRHSGRTVVRLFALLSLRRSRRSLLSLDDHMLRDIGITREQAHAEGSRPVWDTLPNWRR